LHGTYVFSGLPSGNYEVRVGAIAGTPTLTADPDADGTPCTATGATGCDSKKVVTVLPSSSFMGAPSPLSCCPSQ